LALDGLRADAVKWEAIGSSNQQSAISESFTATNAKSAKKKHFNKVFFLCALRDLCGKEVCRMLSAECRLLFPSDTILSLSEIIQKDHSNVPDSHPDCSAAAAAAGSPHR
jgi:hypothetical protein